MRSKGEEVCVAWMEYAMMKAGLQPWDMPVRHYKMFAECFVAEAELTKLEERKQRSQRSKRK